MRDFLSFLQRQNRGFPTSFLVDLSQNRRFVPGFYQFLSHVTKCHACYRICTLSPRAALTMRFAKNMEHDTSNVLRLPREITTEVSKVLRMPQKMQRVIRKRRKSIAPAARNDFGHVMKHVVMSHSAMPATRNKATQRWKPPKTGKTGGH